MGGKSTTSTQSVSIPPEVMARYNAVNARAEEVAKTPFQQYGGQFVAPTTPTQQAGIQATNAASSAAQPYYGAATGLTLSGAQDVGPLTQGQIGYYQNPYTEAVVSPTLQALRQQQGQERSMQQAQAIKSGAFGGDRAGLQRAELARQQTLGTAQAIAPLYQQGYGQAVQTAQSQQGVVASDLARRMQAGQAIAGLGTGAQQAALQGAQAQIGAGTLEQQTQQADLTARYQQFLQERGYDFQTSQFLANIAMGTGALSGSTTTTTQPQGLFSDERLKENIKQVGETNDGLPIYTYNYKGEKTTQMGLIAQDVEKKKPEAVGLAGGFKTVDYDKATEGSERRGREYGGGLAPDYNSMGGAVDLGSAGEAFARGGYALSGSVVDPTDMRSILEANRQSLAPFSQAGLYGGAGGQENPMGGKSYVPKASLATPKMISPAPAPRQQQSGLAEAMQGMRQAQGLGETVSSIGSGVKRAAVGAPAVMRDGKVVEKASTGLIGKGGETGGGVFNPKPAEGVAAGVASAAPAKIADAAAKDSGLVDRATEFVKGLIPFKADGGPVDPHHRLGYAGLGKVINPMELQDPSEGVGAYIDDASESQGENKLNTPGGGGGGGGKSGGIGSDLLQAGQLAMMGAKAAPMVAEGFTALMAALPFSDQRLKSNIEQVGKTFDGQNIYTYNMGNGPTQMGLIAQEVAKKHPDAVGQRKGYMTVDYGAATDRAADRGHFYSGGVVPVRHGYQEGGPPTDERGALFSGLEQEYGLPSGYLNRTYQIESSSGKNLVNPSSSARGHFQFMPATAREMGVEDPMDLNQSARGAAAYAAKNMERLRSAGIENPTAAHLYLAHQQGPGGATNLLTRSDRPAVDLVGRAAVTGNSGDEGMTGSDFANRIMAMYENRKMPDGLGAVGRAAQSVKDTAQRGLGGVERFAKSVLPTTRDDKTGEESFNLKQILIPALTGLGAAASTPTRNLGTAIAAGLGAGAQSYAGLEKQQQDIAASKAGTEKIYSEIPSSAYLTGPEGQVVGIRVYINGNLTSVTPAEFARAARAGTPYSLTPRPGQAQDAPARPAPEQKTEAEIGPVETPATPAAPGTPTAPGVQAPYRTLAKEDQDLVTRNAEQIQQTGTTRLASSPSANPFDAQNDVASEALKALGQRNMFAKALGEIPRNAAAVSSGKFSTDVSTPVVAWVNSILSTVGAPQITSLKDLSNAEVARKISTQLGTKQTTESGQRAYGALQQILTAIPTQANTPESAANLVADIYQVQQREIDLNRYLMQARNLAETRTGLNRNESRYIGDGLIDNFSRRMEQKYSEEKKILSDLYMTPLTYKDDSGKTVRTYMMPYLAGRAGNVPPDLQKEISRRYGPEILRYFSGQ